MIKNVLVNEYFSDIYNNIEIWDKQWNSQSINRIAVCLLPNAKRIETIKSKFNFTFNDEADHPPMWTPEWDNSIIDQLYEIAAKIELNSDYCPAINVPRFVHGQSQGITDLFGAKVEPQFDGNLHYAHPLIPDPVFINNIECLPLDQSLYWGAVEWSRYTDNLLNHSLMITNPVMTGPIDTVNYLLGSTVLMEWIYTYPEVVHNFLDKVTDMIIGMIKSLRDAGGANHPIDFACVREGFDLCSEVRSLLSKSIYEEFEAPYLKRIGESCGTYGIHACGSWERTIQSARKDPNFKAMHGQINENKLDLLCDEADGNILLAIGPSVNVHTEYTWNNMKDFYGHIIKTVPEDQSFEVSIPEDDFQLWCNLYKDIRGQKFEF